VIQLLIAVVLLFVLLFGIGFILNMLLKTTWLPIYVYVLIIIPLVIYSQWEPGSLWDNLGAYSWADYATGVGGLIGAILSGTTIQTLRKKGYKMF
jgi:hypothetical protein